MSNYYFPTCGQYRNIFLDHVPTLFEVEGATYSYSEIVACCHKCKGFVYIPKLNDVNADLRDVIVEINK